MCHGVARSAVITCLSLCWQHAGPLAAWNVLRQRAELRGPGTYVFACTPFPCSLSSWCVLLVSEKYMCIEDSPLCCSVASYVVNGFPCSFACYSYVSYCIPPLACVCVMLAGAHHSLQALLTSTRTAEQKVTAVRALLPELPALFKRVCGPARCANTRHELHTRLVTISRPFDTIVNNGLRA